jgi:hypothetical protein
MTPQISKNNSSEKLILLGFGQVASNLSELVGQSASSYNLIGTSRNTEKCNHLSQNDITPFYIAPDFPLRQQKEFSRIAENANILASLPPHGNSDKLFSSLSAHSKRIIYISSTSVYGNYSGVVDENTAPDWSNPRSKSRLEAEKFWLDAGAIILRAPGLYGPKSGLHLRLGNGTYRLPPKNDNYISRIHLQDLARIISGIFSKLSLSDSIYLIGDSQPATQLEVVSWLCQKLNLAMPALAKPDQVPISLTANRRVNGKKILQELNLQLQFPTFKEGYLNCLKEAGMLNSFDLS